MTRTYSVSTIDMLESFLQMEVGPLKSWFARLSCRFSRYYQHGRYERTEYTVASHFLRPVARLRNGAA